METYANLNGHRMNRSTIPPDLCETEQRPDLVVVMKSPEQRKVLLMELMDCQTSFQAAFDRKTSR